MWYIIIFYSFDARRKDRSQLYADRFQMSSNDKLYIDQYTM